VTARPAATALIPSLRRDIAGLEQRLFDHPYVAAAEAGRLSRDDLRVFAGQQRRIIGSDLRSVALLVHRYGGTPSGEFLAASLATETAAAKKLAAFAEAVGLARSEDPAAVEALPGALAYTHFVAWLALYGSDAEFAAAFLVNLPAWGRNCGRLARALRARYGLSDEAVGFFDLFAGDAPGFEAAATAVIQGGLDRGVAPAAIRDAARLLQHYELMYWDALHTAAGSRAG
jgi:TENA/THI-4/PQQC family